MEKLGTYNPNTNPATIELDIDAAVKWLQNGAQPTDTARAILSYKGALLKNHLAGGVKKGALTEEQAEAKFQSWLDEKNAKISAKSVRVAKEKEDAAAKQLEAEKEINAARQAAAEEAENEAIRAEADAKAAAEAEAKAEEAVEEEAPQTIDEAAEEAKAEGAKEEEAKEEEAKEEEK